MCHDSCASDVSQSYVWHDSFIYVTCPIHVCDMTHSYVRHDPCIYVTWRIHMRDMTDAHLTWFIHVLNKTHLCTQLLQREHSHMWHDSFICVTWLIHMCDMTHSYVWHVTHSYVWHDSFTSDVDHSNTKQLSPFNPNYVQGKHLRVSCDICTWHVTRDIYTSHLHVTRDIYMLLLISARDIWQTIFTCDICTWHAISFMWLWILARDIWLERFIFDFWYVHVTCAIFICDRRNAIFTCDMIYSCSKQPSPFSPN